MNDATVLSLSEANWEAIEGLRAEVASLSSCRSLVEASGRFVEIFAATFESVVLGRVFAVLPFSRLPQREQSYVLSRAREPARVKANTLCLCLLGTRGKLHEWSDRERSADHLAIPLLDSASVRDAPMIAKLLSDLQVDLKVLDDGRPIATRQMLGGRNGTFYVPDARTATDAQGRSIIPALEFTEKFAVRTVFGMGGAYVDGTLVVAIFFCSEALERLAVDRFPSFISSFKMATTALLRDQLFDAPKA